MCRNIRRLVFCMWNLSALPKYNPTLNRRCWKAARATACLETGALHLNRSILSISEAHFCHIQTSYNVIKVGGGKYFSLKCLDKYCIIWAHKWCQDVTCFLRNKWRITESMPPQPHTHTHKSGVNIPHGQTQRQIWRSIKGSGHTLVLSAPTQADFPPSFPLLSADRSPFLHYQCDSRRSFCFWDHSVSSSRLLLLKKYTEGHDDAAAGHPGTLPLTWRWEMTSGLISHL